MDRFKLAATAGLLIGLVTVSYAMAWDEGPPAASQKQAARTPAVQTAQPQAAPAAPATPPPQAVVSKDPAAAAAGDYKLDKNHASVIARVGHGGGFSYSTIRFGVTEGSLTWNPANISASKVSVTVDMTPRYEPIVYSMGPDVANFLNVAQFPSATFTSTAIRATGPATGVITGNLSFRGQTRPVTISASLVGAGRTGRGAPTVGFTGVMKFKRSDFGSNFALAAVSDEIEVVLDAEFGMPAPARPAA